MTLIPSDYQTRRPCASTHAPTRTAPSPGVDVAVLVNAAGIYVHNQHVVSSERADEACDL